MIKEKISKATTTCIVLLILLVVHPKSESYGQKQGQALVDSLVSQLVFIPSDTNMVSAYIKITAQLIHINPDTGISYANRGIALTDKLHWLKGTGILSMNLATLNSINGEYNKALPLYSKALITLKNVNQPDLIANCYAEMGLNRYYMCDYKTADYYYDTALTMFRQQKNKRGIALVLNRSSEIQRIYGNEGEACIRSNEALSLAEEIGDKTLIPYTQIYHALILADFYQYGKSIDYYKKGLAGFKALGYKQYQAHTLILMAEWYVMIRNYQEAQKLLYQSISLRQQNKIGMAYYSLGVLSVKRKKYDSTLYFYKLALNSKSALCNKRRNARYLSKIAEDYLNIYSDTVSGSMPLSKPRLLETSIAYLKRAISVQQEIGALSDLFNSYDYLSIAYAHQGKYKMAYKLHRLSTDIAGRLKSYESKRVFNEAYENFEREKISNENLLLKKDNEVQAAFAAKEKQQKYYLSGGFILVLLFSGITAYGYYRSKSLKFQKKVAETEMTALRSQMNPHFIFNAFNSIHTFIQSNKNEVASSYLLKFSELTRLILENSLHDLVPISDELKALDLYLSLEKVRLSDKIQYTIEVKGIDVENTLIPPLILQPFVENAILHGLQHKSEKGKILVQITNKDNMLCCIISDNGIGRQKAQEIEFGTYARKKESLGMKLTEQRIAIINKIKKSKAYVRVTDIEKHSGVNVELVLPFEIKF